MSEETALMLVDYSARSAVATQAAKDMLELALADSSLIGKVTNAESNDRAVASQLSLAAYMKAVTKAEDAAKGPLNELRGKIIALGKELRAEAESEGMRLAGLVGEFQEKERIRLLAEQNSMREDISATERKEQTELAVAQTVEEADTIREKYAIERAGIVSQPVEAVRSEGQVVKTDWEVTVDNIHLLYLKHQQCVKMEPKMTEIKTLLDLGIAVAGVTAKKVMRGSVRLKPERKAVDV